MSNLESRMAALSPERRALLEQLMRQKSAPPAALTVTPTRPFELIAPAERALLPAGVEDAYPMTMVQQGMTYHMQLTRDRPVPAYHNLSSWNLEAPFELEPFLQSVAVVVARHAYLRTSFDLDRFAEPMQLVHREISLPVAVVDLRALLPARRQAEIERFFRQENRRLFVLDRPPLWRIHVHRRTDKNFQFSLTEPHMISDGWSTTSTLSEMFSHYFALLKGRPMPPAPVLPFSFRDVVAMERASLRSPEAERYFSRVVEGGTAFELPRWPRPAPGARRGRAHDRKPFIAFSTEQVAGLNELARLAGVPIKSVLLAAHLKFLRLRSGRDNVITGLVCNSRPEQPGGDQVRGLFLNTLPFRVPPTAGTWIDLVRATFAAEAEQLPFRHFPGPEVQRRWARAPLFEAAFTYLHFHSLKTLAGSGDFRSLPGRKDPSVSHFTLFAVFDVSVAKGALTLFLEHDDTQLRAEQVRLWYGDYQRILAAMAADPHASEHGVWISAAERHQVVVERNDTATAAVAGTLVELLAAQTRATPGATALVAREGRLSYGELAERVHRLARHLRRAGVGPEVVVALGLERGVELVVAILAVLEAGGAWVYLDPVFPRERLAATLADTGARVLVVRETPRAGWAPPGLRVVALASEAAAIAAEPATAPPVPLGAGNLAHLINTSGSTGKPKAVAIEHRSVVALVAWARGAFAPAELSAVLAATSFGFDLAIFELFVPLALGGAVVLADNVLDLPSLPACQEVTLINTVPSAMEELLAPGERLAGALPAALRAVVLAGEPVLGRLVRKIHDRRPEVRVLDLYGPSETTTYSTGGEIRRGEPGEPTIGRPLAGERAHLLDAHLLPTPGGVAGEIALAGRGLARGYLGRPRQTAERFVPDPFAEAPGERLYRTGDLGRHLADGRLELLGRLDHQVKLHGFRIELGEVEAVLAAHPGVREAVVVVDTVEAGADGAGDRRLVAHVAGEVDLAALRKHLGARLPGYMVPRFFVVLDALPRNANGKVDRRALPAAAGAAQHLRTAHVAPADAVEASIAAVWQELLGLEQVGANDNFFDLGGSSLLILRMQRKLRTSLGRDLPVVDLLRYPTVRTLAASLGGGTGPQPAAQGQERGEERRAGSELRLSQRDLRRAARGR